MLGSNPYPWSVRQPETPTLLRDPILYHKVNSLQYCITPFLFPTFFSLPESLFGFLVC